MILIGSSLFHHFTVQNIFLNMKNTIPLILLMLILVRCGNDPIPSNAPTSSLAPAAQKSVTLRGLYHQTAEGGFLVECSDLAKNVGGHQSATPVVDQTGRLDSLYRSACLPAPVPSESVFAVLSGTTGPGSPLTVTRIDTLTPKNFFNACVPYEFWCSGTEPFWNLQISQGEAGIFLKNMAEERGTAYDWAVPETNGTTTWTYRAQPKSGSSGEPIQVIIRKQTCNDGMSDLRFDYSAEVKLGNQTLRGCAVRHGERVPKE